MNKLLATLALAGTLTLSSSAVYAKWVLQFHTIIVVDDDQFNEDYDTISYSRPGPASWSFPDEASCDAWKAIYDGKTASVQIPKPNTTPVELVNATITYVNVVPCLEWTP